MNKSCLFLGIALFLCLSVEISAKEKKIKFGKIENTHLEATQCPIDSNAHAYYIFDKGNNYFDYNNGFVLYFERHFRIKILDETAYDEAKFEIPIYVGSNTGNEKLTSIKAITYNLENGEVEMTKMEKENIIRENKNKYWDIIKFALPNVKSGSVIEVKYKISSDFFFNLSGWYFQYQIPVLKSNYEIEMPEYYTYNQYPHGYIPYKTIPYKETKTQNTQQGTLTYSTQNYDYVATNVPAFPKTEDLTSIDNYISHINFELANVSIPGYHYKSYSTTWAKVSKQLSEAADLGDIVDQNRYFNDVASILKLAPSKTDQMVAAFSYIKGHTKWNKYNSITASQSLKKTMEIGIGNSADINLSLVGLLRRMELTAYPVVLSTRSHGFINQFFPSLTKFNYVIALCIIDGKEYLMDATSDYSWVNVLPKRCYNNKGLVVNEEREKWVSLYKNSQYKDYISYTLNISNDGLMSGYISYQYSDYAAYLARNDIKDFESIDKYIEDLEEDYDGLTIKNNKIENIDSLDKNVSERFEVEIKDNVEIMGDIMTFTPTLYEGLYLNPLKLEERLYPVEYPYIKNNTIRAIYIIPEGYEIESIPQNIIIKSESGTCVFKYIIQVQENQISLINQIQRNQIIFPYSQYHELKQFYEIIVKKHNEKIVLKRTSL